MPATIPALAERRGLALNFGLLAGGELVSKLVTFAAFTRLARVLGPENYGALEFTLALMVFFTLPVDLGLGSYAAREIASGKREPGPLLREITGLRLLLAFCSLTLYLLLLAILRRPPEVKALMGLYGLSLLGGPALLQWFFQAHERMQWVAVASVMRQSVFAALVFLTVRPGAPLWRAGAAECISVATAALLCIHAARTMGYPARPAIRLGRLREHLRQGAPIGLTELAWAFMWYFATVLLGFFSTERSLGWFGASHRVTMALHTFVWLYFFNLLPAISRCAARPPGELRSLMDRSLRFASWSGIYGALLISALAGPLMTLVYGPRFSGAGPSFALLAWMVPIAMLSGHYRYALIGYNRQDTLFYCTTASAAVAVALGFIAIPLLGPVGAALALLAANAANFVLVYRAVTRLVAPIPFREHLTGPLVAAAAAGFAFLLLQRFNVWAAAGFGSLAYAAVMVWREGRDIVNLFRTTRQKALHTVEAIWAR